jgi:hypothetical protein
VPLRQRFEEVKLLSCSRVDHGVGQRPPARRRARPAFPPI